MKSKNSVCIMIGAIMIILLCLNGCTQTGIIASASSAPMTDSISAGQTNTTIISSSKAEEPSLPVPATSVTSELISVSDYIEESSEPTTIKEPYTFVWITDTQKYSESYPEIYSAMTEWTVNNIEQQNIKMLIHTGDIVNSYSKKSQWKNAVSAMKALDGKLPYTVLAGNHDVGANSGLLDYSMFLENFGEASSSETQKDIFWYRDGESQAMLLDIDGTEYIILALGWGADEAAFDWANELLIKYSERIAIVTTHNYLRVDATVSTFGKTVYDAIVKPNSNVRLVLCGHNHNANRSFSEFDDDGDGVIDRTVWQLIADYQSEIKGGNGFMRLLKIDEETEILSVSTYSPYIDSYNCLDEATDEFSLDISEWFK